MRMPAFRELGVQSRRIDRRAERLHPVPGPIVAPGVLVVKDECGTTTVIGGKAVLGEMLTERRAEARRHGHAARPAPFHAMTAATADDGDESAVKVNVLPPQPQHFGF